MKIRDFIEVSAQPTVVRLDQLKEATAGWISQSYYITEEIEKHFKALKHLLGQGSGCGMFLIGHYGSGKSHFLAYLSQQIRAGSFSSRNPFVLPISLLNYKASQNLESIVEQELPVTPSASDRRVAWQEVGKRYPEGLFLVLDELSEFLRAKPSRPSFNEDIRFLQFLGEWSQDHPLWVLAALQEQIEHTGDIEYDLYRKIKDRYPVRFLLTPTHIKSLISGKILRKKPTYPSAVEKLAKDLREVFPNSSISFADFCEIYPLHPATLELLEEVRDRFSQARGIVDFTLTQLLGNEARAILPFLDQPWGHLISPDLIVDHFRDLFEIQPEFQAIAQKVFPYYRKHIPLLFDKKLQQELAWRLLKLLVLVHLSPARKTLDLQEAAQWLLFKVSTIDPQKNLEVIERVLDILVKEGAYLKREGSHYHLDLEDESQQNLDQLLSKAVEELRGRGDTIFETLLPCLQQEDFNPFTFPRERWHSRKVRWHFHEREVQIFFGGSQPPEPKGVALQIGLPWGPQPEGIHCFKILPKRLELTPEIFELAALLQLKERPSAARLLERVEERISSRGLWFGSLIRTAYSEVSLMNASGATVLPPFNNRPGSLNSWLNSYGEWMLRQTYPQFERFAPGHGALPKEAYRQFMKQAMEHDLASEEAPEYVKLIREAYLVPMGLMQRKGPEYLMHAKLDQHELVTLLTPILEHHPSPRRVYEHLSGPVYGLVPDQIHLLLLTLLIMGEIDILKGNSSYRETYETLPNPIQYDKIVPGRALNLNQLRDLQTLCEGFGIRIPKQWSVLAQRRTIDQLRKEGRRQRDLWSDFLVKLKEQGEGGDMASEVEKFITQWLALEKGDNELQGFQHFLFAIGSPRRFVAQAKEWASLPDRFEKLLRETQRYRHLFSYPCVAHCPNPDIGVNLEKLGQPPSLADSEALQIWLSQARDLYLQYQGWYQEQHEQWWGKIRKHPIWSHRRPSVSKSKHLVMEDLNRELEARQARAKTEACSGLASMEFQPLCRCGFDGKDSPIAETLRRFEAASARLETELGLFFQQDKVKKRVKDWVDQGLELNTRTLSYLDGKADYPEIENLVLFDQHLSGLELVQNVNAEEILELLQDRTWEKQDLLKALDRFFERFGPRIAIRQQESVPRRSLVAWCVEHALRLGSSLPPAYSLAEKKLMAELVQPQWVSEASLARLEALGLSEEALNRVLEMMLDGKISIPSNPPEGGAIRAALELLQPTKPASAEELTQRVTQLYLQHQRFMQIRPKPWLSHLNQLANTELTVPPEPLAHLLRAHLNHQWVLIDCLGVPFLDVVKESLREGFPHWKLTEVSYGLVSPESRTDAFYASLIEEGFQKSLEKINGLDALMHTRKCSLSDLAHLARAELEIACKKILPKLDPTRPLLVFGDHGFRLTADGGGFSHGGPSTLERLVPILKLDPYEES